MVSLHDELTAILKAAEIPDAALEARWILEDIPDADTACAIAKRRAAHEPLQYLLGAWEFYGMRFFVGEGVLIPRADTETAVDAVLERMRNIAAPRIADLCTGSGCIALALQAHLPHAEVCGIEYSADALAYAQKNAAYHRLPTALYHADVLDPQTAAQFHGLDCIVSNPPYLTAEDMADLQAEVKYEPALALAGGTDGLHFYRTITQLWRQALKSGGLLVYEVGIHQADAVAALLRENGFTDIEKLRDLNGIERAVLGTAA